MCLQVRLQNSVLYTGMTCQHFYGVCVCVCVHSNFAEAARLLLEHGADANSKDSRENTAAMAAGALGHYEVLEVLLDHRLLNIHAGVSGVFYSDKISWHKIY